MISLRTPAFRDAFAKLPEDARELAKEAYYLFRQDPSHPSLQFKHIGASIYSARVGLHYRTLGLLEGDTITWIWIGTHAEYDHKVKQWGGRKRR